MIVRRWSRLLVVALIAAACWGNIQPVHAETAASTSVTATEVAAEPAPQPVLSSESAILIDARTGTVLFERNADQELFPASITKIVTGIIAIEHEADLSQMVTVSQDARNEEGTRIYLSAGEQQSLRNLLYGMLLNSGNDAATAIAEYIDGSKAQFAQRMNEFVGETIGTTHTHFVNPNGLPDPEQVTTARDMAMIARYAMRNGTFRTIVGTRRMPWNGKEWKSELINHNEMLGQYEGTTGIKNGYTGEAGFTLVTSAKRNGMELIGVLLKSPTQKMLYKDMTHLLDYGFQAFEEQQVALPNPAYPFAAESSNGYAASEPLYAVVPKGEVPSVHVTAEGEVSALTSLGIEQVGKLAPRPPSIASLPKSYAAVGTLSAERAETATSDKRPAASKKAEIFFLWIGLLAYMAILAAIRAKRRKLARERGC